MCLLPGTRKVFLPLSAISLFPEFGGGGKEGKREGGKEGRATHHFFYILGVGGDGDGGGMYRYIPMPPSLFSGRDQ